MEGLDDSLLLNMMNNIRRKKKGCWSEMTGIDIY